MPPDGQSWGWKARLRQRVTDRFLKPHQPTCRDEAASLDSYQAMKDRQRALFQFVWDKIPDAELYITLRFNQPLPRNEVRRRLRFFDAIIRRRLCGKKWAKSTDSPFSFIFLENGADGCVHAHIIMRMPRRPRLRLTRYPVRNNEKGHPYYPHLSWLFTGWVKSKGVAPAGDVVVKPLVGPADVLSTVSYSLKTACDWHSGIDWHVSTEFSSNTTPSINV